MVENCTSSTAIVLCLTLNHDFLQSALEEAYSERVQDAVGHERDEFHVSWLGVFMQVSAWMIFGVGLIYMLLGLCCLKKLRDKLKEDDRKKWIEFREAKKILKKYQK